MRRGARSALGLTAASVLVTGLTGPAVAQEVARAATTYEVVNPNDGQTYTLTGFEMTAACAADTVVLLLHGLSYTGEAWDVPGYSYARILAAGGYDVVAVDRLGYGGSALEDGRNVTTFGHADMAAQLVTQLSGRYDDVVLAGHSAGAETSVSAVGLDRAPVSALVAMGYHTYPGPEFLVGDWILGDQVNALADDYVYFLGTPERRAELFYTAENADTEVIDADTAAAVLTPSGEIQTLSVQPARIGSALVDVPVLLQLGEDDQLFPVGFADLWEAQFLSAPSVTTDVVAGSAHTYMLHHEGPAAAERIVDWLATTAALPGCVTTTAAPTPVAAEDVGDPGDPDVSDRERDDDLAAQAGEDAVPLPATGTGLAGIALLGLVGAGLLRGRRT